MKRPLFLLERTLALFLVWSMVCSFAQAATVWQGSQQTTPPATVDASSDASSNASSNASSSSQTDSVEKVPQSLTPPSTGTALAPYEKQGGITGSKPAGAAIAPGKQHRTRSFAIRAGLLVGAAIAIGVVAGASLGSPARAN